MFELLNPIWNIIGIVSVLVGAVWWLQSQFSSQKSYFFTQMEKLQQSILNKIEYHERHDDKRFADVRDDIWEIRLRNAAIDGTRVPARYRKEFVDQSEKDETNT